MTRSRESVFWRQVGGVLEGVRVELVAEAQVEFTGGGAGWFLGVRASIQNVDRGDSSPCRRHQVRAVFREIRPVFLWTR